MLIYLIYYSLLFCRFYIKEILYSKSMTNDKKRIFVIKPINKYLEICQSLFTLININNQVHVILKNIKRSTICYLLQLKVNN